MTGRAALLAAIFEAPDDDAPRLVYADWLDIDGPESERDPARAELIRIQCRQARIGSLSAYFFDGEPEREEFDRMTRRAIQLLNEHGAKWLGPAVNFQVHYCDRGFLQSATCSAADWLAHADTILAAHPVTEVRLTTWPPLRRASGQAGIGWVWCFDNRPASLLARYEASERDITDLLVRKCWPRVKTWHLPPEQRSGIGMGRIEVEGEYEFDQESFRRLQAILARNARP